MSQAHAEDRQLSGEVLDGLDTDPRVLRFSRTRVRGSVASGFIASISSMVCVIVSDHFDLRLYRSDELIQVIRKTVVIINE